MRPRLKPMVMKRDGQDLAVTSRLERLVLEDPSGDVERLLALLEAGGRSIAELSREVDWLAPWELADAIESLNGLGLLIDEDTGPEADPRSGAARWASNLSFFTTFGSLSRSAGAFQQAIRDAHVLVLGVGGLGSAALMCMAGLGVGRLTVVDADQVELRNFARQFVYRHQDVGESKVARAADWVVRFDPTVEVRAVEQWIQSADDVARLLDGVDLVIAAADRPARDIGLWVNEACVVAGVPVIGGGMSFNEMAYWSVDPGRSPCFACSTHGVEPAVPGVDEDGNNPGIGPVSSLIGAQVALEATRYLTAFAPPAAAGAPRVTDVRTGVEEVRVWERWPDCPVCSRACTGRERQLESSRDG